MGVLVSLALRLLEIAAMAVPGSISLALYLLMLRLLVLVNHCSELEMDKRQILIIPPNRTFYARALSLFNNACTCIKSDMARPELLPRGPGR